MTESDWQGCYKESWKGVIVDEVFAHPAKFSRALIRLIYRHASELGWLERGSTVIDPFGGVALGAFDAMWLGANWVGCELELKFVELGNQNIAAWNQRLDHLKTWGSARLIQGDSRKLSEVLREAGLCVSSPPFSPDQPCASQTKAFKDYEAQKHGTKRDQVMVSEGDLQAMKEGDFNLAVSSPPYADAKAHPSIGAASRQDWVNREGGDIAKRRGVDGDYADQSPGQLGAMRESKEGFELSISSPPYADQQVGTGAEERKGWRGYTDHGGGTRAQEGQLASKPAMKEGFDLSVSSPPYEEQPGHGGTSGRFEELALGKGLHSVVYGRTRGQLGVRGGDFWSAARQIVAETYKVLIPGAHAIWVVKGFVRKGKYVDFPDQWRRLCEAVGFKTLHWHRAWLIEKGNQQQGLDGEITDYSIERKSFFRRLSESKGSPKIDFEVVLCMEK